MSPQVTASDETLDVWLDNQHYQNLKLNTDETIAFINGKSVHVDVQNFSGFSLSKIAMGLVNQGSLDIESQINLVQPDDSYIYGDLVTRNGILLGVGREPIENLRVGAAIKGLYKYERYVNVDTVGLLEKALMPDAKLGSLLNEGKGFGVGFDLGLAWTLPGPFVNVIVGLAILDVGSTKYRGSPTPREDPQMVNVGVALKTEVDGQTFTETFDIVDAAFAQKQSVYNHLHMGLRWAYQNYFGVQVGINQGYPTAGIFGRYKVIEIGYARYGVELGSTPGQRPNLRHAAELKLGWVL